MKCTTPATPASSASPNETEPQTELEVTALRTSAEDALARSFAIFACKSHDKGPDPKYSPNGFKDATTNRTRATLPYLAGIPANYGVACGASDLAVVDCDHGLKSYDDLKSWMQRNHLPETLTVRTGRDGETGFHLFYSGARPTTNFDLDGVVGQIKSEGGYVIGPGSIHPSGKVYQIINDVPLASFPVGVFPAQAKSKSIMVTANPVIPEGNRWPNLQSKAGTFRNAGLSRDGIYHALKDFAANRCADGESYPDDKIQQLADWAASDKCDETATPGTKRLGHADLITEDTQNSQLTEIVSSLISRKTVNIAVGDSTLGKTPFFFQMALCVALGLPFIGQDTVRGRVLIADYENYSGISRLIETLARFLKIETPVSSEWLGVVRGLEPKELTREIEEFRPALVIVDSLRGYNAKAEVDNTVASDMVARCQNVAQACDSAWVFIHHTRKQDRNQRVTEKPDLFRPETPVVEWLEEAAGPRALINQTHTRIGFARPKGRDLGIRGVIKLVGEFGPWLLDREYDDTGTPIGYKRVYGSDLLSSGDKLVFNLLPVDEPLTFTGVLKVLYEGNVSKKKFVSQFLRRCIDAGVVEPNGKDHTVTKTYTRVKEGQ